jgi:hypothetical protein
MQIAEKKSYNRGMSFAAAGVLAAFAWVCFILINWHAIGRAANY